MNAPRHFRELLTRSEERIASNILADPLTAPGESRIGARPCAHRVRRSPCHRRCAPVRVAETVSRYAPIP